MMVDLEHAPTPERKLRLPCNNSVLWPIAASVAIVTTKILAVDRNFHFPDTLLALQCIVAICFRILIAVLRPDDTPFGPLGHMQSRPMTWSFAAGLIIYGVSSAAALICGYQAFLHAPNLVTQVMVLCLEIRPDRLVASLVNCDQVWLAKYIALLVFVMLIILGDYRIDLVLTVHGPASLLVSFTCAAIARCVRPTLLRCEQVSLSTHGRSTLLFSAQMFCTLSFTLLRTRSRWNRLSPDDTFRGIAVLLVVSCCAGGYALAAGGSIFRRIFEHGNIDEHQYQSIFLADLDCTLVGIAMAAATFLSYVALGRSTVVSEVQCFAFLVGAFVIYSVEDLKSCLIPHRWPSFGETMKGPVMDSAETALLVDEAQEEPSVQSCDSLFTVRNLSLATIFIAWPALLCWSFINQPSHNGKPLRPNLDMSYASPHPFDIVVARYEEPAEDVLKMIDRVIGLPNIRHLIGNKAPRIFMYNKGNPNETFDVPESLSNMRSSSAELLVTTRPNVGREAETFLNHFIDQYDDLATHTLYMQAGLEHSRTALRRLNDYIVADTGFLSLSYSGQYSSSCEAHYGDTSGWYETPAILRRLFDLTNHNNGSTAECERLVRTYRGQFVASAARVRGVARENWREIWRLLVDPESEVHREPYLQPYNQRIRVDKMSAPIFGYTMERAWGMVMQCQSSRVAERCPSLLSGLIGWKGEAEDCQCLDDPW